MLLYSNTIIIICSDNTIMLKYKYTSYNSALLQSAHTDYNYTAIIITGTSIANAYNRSFSIQL